MVEIFGLLELGRKYASCAGDAYPSELEVVLAGGGDYRCYSEDTPYAQAILEAWGELYSLLVEARRAGFWEGVEAERGR